MNQPPHSKISITAKLVAYLRRTTDIQYAKEVAEWIGAREALEKIFDKTGVTEAEVSILTPSLEARYKSLTHALKKENITQILEVASGVSLRGLAMSQDHSLLYVESDLPELTKEKTLLVDALVKSKIAHKGNNIFFENCNALSLTDLKNATRHFSKDKPIAILHEGFFQYLSKEEKYLAATNFKALLKEHGGGVWLTTDLNPISDLDTDHPYFAILGKLRDAINSITDRNFVTNSFKDNAELENFIHSLGFDFRVTEQYDGSYTMKSLEQVNLPKDVLEKYFKRMLLWKMELRKN